MKRTGILFQIVASLALAALLVGVVVGDLARRYETRNLQAQLKEQAEMSLKIQQDDHREREAAAKKDKRSLKLELKELELAHEDAIRELKQVARLPRPRLTPQLGRPLNRGGRVRSCSRRKTTRTSRSCGSSTSARGRSCWQNTSER